MTRTILKAIRGVSSRLNFGAGHAEEILKEMDAGHVGYDQASAQLAAAVDHMICASHDLDQAEERIEKISGRLAKAADKAGELYAWLGNIEKPSETEERIMDRLSEIQGMVQNCRYALGVRMERNSE